MTGTIAIFNDKCASGVISAEDGLRVRFDSSAVLAYDIAKLSVGQSVTFDVLRGNHPKAFNVCVERLRDARTGGSHETSPLRYMGFEQNGSLRTYRFERILLGEHRRAFSVNADLALFAKHHVGIQEGPGLCLRLLLAATLLLPAYALTDREMLVYLANRPAPGRRSGPRHPA